MLPITRPLITALPVSTGWMNWTLARRSTRSSRQCILPRIMPLRRITRVPVQRAPPSRRPSTNKSWQSRSIPVTHPLRRIDDVAAGGDRLVPGLVDFEVGEAEPGAAVRAVGGIGDGRCGELAAAIVAQHGAMRWLRAHPVAQAVDRRWSGCPGRGGEGRPTSHRGIGSSSLRVRTGRARAVSGGSPRRSSSLRVRMGGPLGGGSKTSSACFSLRVRMGGPAGALGAGCRVASPDRPGSAVRAGALRRFLELLLLVNPDRGGGFGRLGACSGSFRLVGADRGAGGWRRGRRRVGALVGRRAEGRLRLGPRIHHLAVGHLEVRAAAPAVAGDHLLRFVLLVTTVWAGDGNPLPRRRVASHG